LVEVIRDRQRLSSLTTSDVEARPFETNVDKLVGDDRRSDLLIPAHILLRFNPHRLSEKPSSDDLARALTGALSL
jgi:hypothetical protein